MLPQRDPSLARWSDADAHIAQGPTLAFRTNPGDGRDGQLPTVGHIGRYALKYPIGEGGLGTVYAAHDPLLSRLIAIKTLRLRLDDAVRPAFQELFLREARAAASLSHPHIVTVHDAGLTEDGAYIAMELLKGRDLRLLRQEGWRPTPQQAALIVRRVADALAYAHSRGVVHRDIKPANIFMVSRTQPRVLDFGIASVAHRHEAGAGPAAPEVGVDWIAGSPHYMSPEQVQSLPTDKRTDVFSLGVVLYELLTDRKPFTGQTLAEVTEAVLTHEPPLAHEVDAKVPPALSEVLRKALRKDPAERYASVRQMARDLRQWLEDEAASADPVDEPVATSGHRAPRWGLPIAMGAGAAAVVTAWALLGGEAGTPQRGALATGGFVQGAAAPAVSAAPAGASSPESLSAAPLPTAAVQAQTAALGGLVTSPPDTLPGSPPTAAASTTPATPTSQTAATPAEGPQTPARAPRAAAPRAVAPAPGPAAAGAATPAAAAATAAPVPVATGELRLAVSPWGEIEVDGQARGIAPPLSLVTLPEGMHRITIRNADFPPFSATVQVTAGQTTVVRHRFGS